MVEAHLYLRFDQLHRISFRERLEVPAYWFNVLDFSHTVRCVRAKVYFSLDHLIPHVKNDALFMLSSKMMCINVC